MKVNKAVVVTGGRDTQFLPVTKAQPREMLPLVDRPLIQYAVEEAVICGAELVVIVIMRNGGVIEDHFDRNVELESFLEQEEESKLLQKIRRLSGMADICYIRRDAQVGLGNAILTTKRVIGEDPFMLIIPDDLFDRTNLVLRQMLEVYEQCCSSVVALRRVSQDQLWRYDIVSPRKAGENVYELKGIIDKPGPDAAPSNLAIIGRYVLMPEIFEALEAAPPDVAGEIRMADALALLLRGQAIHGYLFDGDYYDVGTPLGLLKATITLAVRHPEIGAAMREHISNLYIMPEVHMVKKGRL